jgi:AcrR family transcriptional regulator
MRRRSIYDGLARAATKLFAEQGYDATTVEQIAGEAGVALRTFYRYCSSKADAVVPSIERELPQILATIEVTTAGQTLRPVVLDAVCEAVGEDDSALGHQVATILLTIPELMPRWLEANRRLHRGLVETLPRRFPVADGLEAEMTAAVVTSAVATAVTHAILTGQALRSLLEETLTHVPDLATRE